MRVKGRKVRVRGQEVRVRGQEVRGRGRKVRVMAKSHTAQGSSSLCTDIIGVLHSPPRVLRVCGGDGRLRPHWPPRQRGALPEQGGRVAGAGGTHTEFAFGTQQRQWVSRAAAERRLHGHHAMVVCGAGGGTPLRHPGPAKAQPCLNVPGSHLDTPNGAFKVGPKASHRRLQV